MRPLAAFVLAAALAGPAWAATAAAPATPAPPPRIFLSPAGEPFRLSPATPDPLKAWFDQADANHDGVIDKAEFRADAVRFFKLLDANDDGAIDGFESADYENKIVPEFAEWAEGRFPGQFPQTRGQGGHESGGHDGGDGHDGGRQRGLFGGGKGARPPASRGIAQLLDEPEPVTGADFALDGRITLAEWIKASDQRFDLLDVSKSGRLTLAVLRARLNLPAPAKR
jgi:hypothetical protein